MKRGLLVLLAGLTVYSGAGATESLSVMSWNVKHLGRQGFNFADSSLLLDRPDIITFQEVNTEASGKLSGQKALMTFVKHLEGRLHEKICVALSEIKKGARERYAYLWKNRRVAYIKADGQIMENCPPTALTIRLGVRHVGAIARPPAFGTFYFKPQKKPFVLASIHLVPSGKKPQLEVPPLFDTFKDVQGPVIIAGDYNLDSTHSAFAAARALKFQAAMKGVKTSLKMKKRELNKPYDNFWYRGVQLVRAEVINTYKAFPKLSARQIYDSISDHSPITAEFVFAP